MAEAACKDTGNRRVGSAQFAQQQSEVIICSLQEASRVPSPEGGHPFLPRQTPRTRCLPSPAATARHHQGPDTMQSGLGTAGVIKWRNRRTSKESSRSSGISERPGELGSEGASRASSIVAEMSSVEVTRSQRRPAGSARRCSSSGVPAQHRIPGTRMLSS